MSNGKIAATPTPSIHARTRSGMRIPLRPAQECDPPDRQPLGYKNVAIVEKDRIMRRDELPRRTLWTRLATPRSHFAVLCFSVSQSGNHVEVSIENTHLAIQVGAHHPLPLSVKIARHSQVRLVFDCSQVNAIECKSLNAAVPAIGHDQQRLFSAWVQPEPVWSVQFPVAVSRLADLT